MKRIISCSLSPNTEGDDVWLALRLLFSPWKWKRGAAAQKVETHFGGVSFNSGRAALFAILRAYAIGQGDEVILQAFTCVAVADSIRRTGAVPVYADINTAFNIDIDDVAKKITNKTKAIIVQHTFGVSADMDAVLALAKKYHIRVIEDFAHIMSLPLRGDAGFYTFGRDKVVSSVFGGLTRITSNTKLKTYHKTLEYPSSFWIFQQLLHPVAFSVILPLYRSGIGKALLVFLQRLHLLSFPHISDVKRYPNALAILLLHQLKKLDRYTKQRREISRLYGKDVAYLRFPMLVGDPQAVSARAKKQGILLGNWYHNVVDPQDAGYKRGSCPRAEEAAQHIINLPTRISPAEAKRVLAVL